MKEYIFEIYEKTTEDGGHPAKMKEELIRCKDCKYRLHLDATDCYPAGYQCRLDERVFFPSRKANDPEWYCADGERRTDENNN